MSHLRRITKTLISTLGQPMHEEFSEAIKQKDLGCKDSTFATPCMKSMGQQKIKDQ